MFPRKMISRIFFKIHSPRAGGVLQVLQRLPSKCEALSSNPSTAKKKKKTKNPQSILPDSYVDDVFVNTSKKKEKEKENLCS
jgi:hypothetical protein